MHADITVYHAKNATPVRFSLFTTLRMQLQPDFHCLPRYECNSSLILITPSVKVEIPVLALF